MSWLNDSTDTIQALAILLIVLTDRRRDKSIRALRAELRDHKNSTSAGKL